MTTRESSKDMVAFVAEIGKRYTATMGKAARLTGKRPVLNKERLAQVALLQRVINRFNAGKFYHRDEEVQPINSLAEFVINMHRTMIGAPEQGFQADPQNLIKAGKSSSTSTSA